MSTLRSLRLLGAVEAGTVTGAQLETFLADVGRRSELSVLLSSRGQSRRMAGSPLTMGAIVSSPAAINVVFQAATTATSNACQAVVQSPIAMNSVSNSAPSLNVVVANPVSWGLFSGSTYFETNVRAAVANLAGVDPNVYPTVTALINDSQSMSKVTASAAAMSAVVASPATTALLAANQVAMAMVASSASATTTLTAQTSIMGIVAGSTVAMTELNNHAASTAILSNQIGALGVVAGTSAAWTSFMAGPYFSSNLPAIVANLAGLSTSVYPTLASIIADASALGKVALVKNAVAALASNATALSSLASSPNLGVMLGSTTAMSVLGPNTNAMSAFLSNSGSWAGIFGSSVAKGFIAASTPLVDAIAGNAALIKYLGSFTTTVGPGVVPDGVPGTFQPFPGVPAKVLILAAKEIGIAATYSDYRFGGTTIAGTTAGTTLHLTGASTLTHVAAYAGLTWDFAGAGVTAATEPVITYVDMT